MPIYIQRKSGLKLNKMHKFFLKIIRYIKNKFIRCLMLNKNKLIFYFNRLCQQATILRGFYNIQKCILNL